MCTCLPHSRCSLSEQCVHRSPRTTPRVQDQFSRFVKRGELVELDQVVEHDFHTVYPCQSTVNFGIFCMTDNEEERTTDPGMRRLATMKLELPAPHTAKPRKLKARHAAQAGKGALR